MGHSQMWHYSDMGAYGLLRRERGDYEVQAKPPISQGAMWVAGSAFKKEHSNMSITLSTVRPCVPSFLWRRTARPLRLKVKAFEDTWH